MIWTIIVLAAVLLAITIGVINACKWNCNAVEIFSCIILDAGGVVLFVMILAIIISHAAVDKRISKMQMKHDYIIQEIKAVNNEWEDMSVVSVIQEVSEWNQGVLSDKYWAKNPWTNWFYSQKYVDALEYIDLREGD